MWVLLFVLSPVGLVLLAIGIILRLCESSWQKRLGSMGSVWFIGIGAVLSIPLALYLGPAVLEKLFH